MNAPKALVWVAALLLATCALHPYHRLAAAAARARHRARRYGARAQSRASVALPPIWIPFVLWAALGRALARLVDRARAHPQGVAQRGVLCRRRALGLFRGAQARGARQDLSACGRARGARRLRARLSARRGWDRYQQGLHGGPGNHSSALLMLMPCALMAGWYAVRAGWPRWIGCSAPAALAALFLASAYTTLNRTVWLGFAVELSFSAAAAAPRPAAPTAHRAPVIAVLALRARGQRHVHTDIQAGARRSARPAVDEDPRLALWPEVAEQSASGR